MGREDRAARFREQLDGGIDFFLRAARHGNVGTGGRKTFRDAEIDAARSAENEYLLTFEIESRRHAFFLGSLDRASVSFGRRRNAITGPSPVAAIGSAA